MRSILFCSLMLAMALPAAALTIDRETVWKGDLHFREPVRVKAGATLTVAPGSRIVFDGGKLEVAGRLVADAARFSGSNWEGIVLKGCDATTVISGGSVTGAKTGIFVGGGAPRIVGVALQENEVGLELKQKSAAEVRDCRIERNRKVGLFIKDESTPQVSGTLIRQNGKFGIYIYRAIPERFSGNRFEENETALMIANAGSDPLVEGNRFERNRLAISIDRAARPQLRGNLLRGNQVGIKLYRRADAEIVGNRFEENQVALSLAFSSYPTIAGNDFRGNRRALELEYQSSLWESEKGEATREAEAGTRGAFGQPTGHAETAEARRRPEVLTGWVEARNNWWGEEGTAELERLGSEGNPSFIQDGRDSPTFVEGGRTWPLDRARFAPWRSAPAVPVTSE